MVTARIRSAARRLATLGWLIGLVFVLLLVLFGLSLAPGQQTRLAAEPPASEATAVSEAVVSPAPVALAPLTGPGHSAVRDGRIEVDGQPFFPLGFYYNGWVVNEGPTPRRVYDDLKRIAAAGFNTIHIASSDVPPGRFGEYLDLAASLGVKVLCYDVAEEVVDRYKGHPAVLGWSYGDDFNWPPPPRVGEPENTPAALNAQRAAIMARDPNHITYISGSAYPGGFGQEPTKIRDYLRAADLLAFQMYPVGSGNSEQALRDESDRNARRAVSELAGAGAIPIANLQSFNWGDPRILHPTLNESRNMLYTHLIYGFKGVWYYTYVDEENDLADHPDVFAVLASLVPEVAVLAPALTGGARTMVATGTADIRAATWTYQGKIYAVVLNLSYTAARQVSLPLPAGATGPARPLFAGRPAGLTFADGQLRGAIGPTDVHVYVLDAPVSACGATGACVRTPFLAYWDDHGGLARNGYPLSDERVETLEDGQARRVQYFERVRLEYHPENQPPYDILLGQFGRLIRPADPPAAPIPGQRYVAETGHNLGGRFLAYWQANGGLAQFGFPISEVFEQQLEDGKAYQVQYFERAQFEYHPENAPPYDVLLGQFGRHLLAEAERR